MEPHRRIAVQLALLGTTLVAAAVVPAVLGWAPVFTALALVPPVGGLLRAWRVVRATRSVSGLEGAFVLVSARVVAVRPGGLELEHEGTALLVPAAEARWAVSRGERSPSVATGLRVECYGLVDRRDTDRLRLRRCWLSVEPGLRWRLPALALRGWVQVASIELTLLVVMALAAVVGGAGAG